jgi:hypothetical protein
LSVGMTYQRESRGTVGTRQVVNYAVRSFVWLLSGSCSVVGPSFSSVFNGWVVVGKERSQNGMSRWSWRRGSQHLVGVREREPMVMWERSGKYRGKKSWKTGKTRVL